MKKERKEEKKEVEEEEEDDEDEDTEEGGGGGEDEERGVNDDKEEEEEKDNDDNDDEEEEALIAEATEAEIEPCKGLNTFQSLTLLSPEYTPNQSISKESVMFPSSSLCCILTLGLYISSGLNILDADHTENPKLSILLYCACGSYPE